MHDRIRIKSVTVLSDNWGVLKNTALDYRRSDGTWEAQTRETYERGNGATVLPLDAERGTILLVRQFRFPAYVEGHPEPLIEACAGLLDDDDAETCARREAEEELGYRLHELKQVFMPFTSSRKRSGAPCLLHRALFTRRPHIGRRRSRGRGRGHRGGGDAAG